MMECILELMLCVAEVIMYRFCIEYSDIFRWPWYSVLSLIKNNQFCGANSLWSGTSSVSNLN